MNDLMWVDLVLNVAAGGVIGFLWDRRRRDVGKWRAAAEEWGKATSEWAKLVDDAFIQGLRHGVDYGRTGPDVDPELIAGMARDALELQHAANAVENLARAP